jgi:hypothetical protein
MTRSPHRNDPHRIFAARRPDRRNHHPVNFADAQNPRLVAARRRQIEARAAVKQLPSPDEIESMLLGIGPPLLLIPFEAPGVCG